jgi:hypothetical protein
MTTKREDERSYKNTEMMPDQQSYFITPRQNFFTTRLEQKKVY